MGTRTRFEFKESNTQPVREQPAVTAVPRSSQPSMRMVDSLVVEFRQAKRAVMLAFMAGIVIGLPLLGWGLWPVRYTDGPLSGLSAAHKGIVVQMAADLAAYDKLSPRIAAMSYQWTSMDIEACNLAASESDPASRARLVSLAYRVNGVGCGERQQ